MSDEPLFEAWKKQRANVSAPEDFSERVMRAARQTQPQRALLWQRVGRRLVSWSATAAASVVFLWRLMNAFSIFFVS